MKWLNISIPRPCHEDWNQMTPEERGRFCSLCKKTVLDFSEKTQEEILEFIESHRNEKICGRFRSEQLAEFSRIELPMPVYRPQMSFINAFLVTLLFCFGTSLFSCNIPSTPALGKVEVASAKIPVENIPDSSKRMMIGEVERIPAKPDSDSVSFHKGKVRIEVDTMVDLPPLFVTDSVRLWSGGKMMLGALAYEVIYDDGPSLFDEAGTVTEKENTLPADGDFFTSVYPNPSNGLVNIKFQFTEEQNVRMDLYDLSGRLIRNLLANELMQSELRTVQVHISDQPPGIYFLRIVAGDKVKTERIVLADR